MLQKSENIEQLLKGKWMNEERKFNQHGNSKNGKSNISADYDRKHQHISNNKGRI